ncbi:MAG: DUF501 domain-containing protein [bacterium]|nr:DUF501 domain-containing protein [bacterium]
MDDRLQVAVQIGRPSRADIQVVSRCHLSLPVVVQVPPILDDGTPFPTLYWLSCPLAVRRVSRLESGGGVKAMERRAARLPEFGAALEAAHARYARQRNTLLPSDAEHTPSGGVAGAARGVKCLHAHYADARAGNPNPVGELVAPWVEPLDCPVPCVTEHNGQPVGNPHWVEPR